MNYVIVNHRRPKDAAQCVICPAELTDHYVKDLTTGLHYCSAECVAWHTFETERAIERRRA